MDTTTNPSTSGTETALSPSPSTPSSSRINSDLHSNNPTTTGLVYLSRIPPSMSPTQLKMLLNQHAKVKRVFLAKENAKSTQRRKKYKGNGRVRYVEGWVEFEHKNDAKRIAKLLNGSVMGGKKLSKFHDDIWTIKYLPGFHWQDLTEQIAYEKKQRELRLRNEIIQAKKESKLYLKQVATSKMISAIQKKAQKKQEKLQTIDIEPINDHQVMEALQTRFKQYKVENKDYEQRDKSSSEMALDGSALFDKLFGKQKI